MADNQRPLREPFDDMSNRTRLILAGLAPIILGVVAGAFLVPLPVFYIAVQIIATVGGFYAGLEHRQMSEAVVRGFTAGLAYGTAILLVHVWFGGDDHGFIGSNPALLPFITALLGALFGVIGSAIRRRREGPR